MLTALIGSGLILLHKLILFLIFLRWSGEDNSKNGKIIEY